MSLFDAIARTDFDDMLYAEPFFRYLNRSARPSFTVIRRTLDEWFARYPTDKQAEFRRRFRSDDRSHEAAYFELCLHEALLRLDCRNIDIEPELTGGKRTRPDFLVESPHGDRFYLEATVSTGESREQAAARARQNAVYDALNRLDSPNFFLGVRVAGAPATPPPAKPMRRFLAARLAELDPDAMEDASAGRGFDALPHWQFEHDGWSITFFPIPKTATARGTGGVRPLAFRMSEPGYIYPQGGLRESILAKAARYGEFDLPYVVAVNALGLVRDEVDVLDALMGDRTLAIRFDADGTLTEAGSREHNGVWIGPQGIQCTRVSAVLIAESLHPIRMAESSVAIWHNPWAAIRFDSILNTFPQYVPSENQMRRVEGRTLAEVLGLPPDWPGPPD